MQLRHGMAIDLGTVNTLVHVHGKGIVLDEPSAVALRTSTQKLVAVGAIADGLSGREPDGISVVHPLRDGVISDLDAAAAMLQAFVHKAQPHLGFLRPTAIICVPSGSTFVERQAVVSALAMQRPHFVVKLMDEPVAAAFGAGLDPFGGDGVLVVDVGGGTTEVALVAGGGLVRARSLRIGGNAMDESIAHDIKSEFGIAIGCRSAEQLKMRLGLVAPQGREVRVAGVDEALGALREVVVPPELVARSLSHCVAAIVDSIEQVLTEMPPDLAGDVFHGKIRLAGGGALLPGLANRIESSVGVRVAVVQDPLRCIVRGAAVLLQGDDPLGSLRAA